MRLFPWVLMIVLAMVVVYGVIDVPLHDGDVVEATMFVLLPTLGIGWCLWQIIPFPANSRP